MPRLGAWVVVFAVAALLVVAVILDRRGGAGAESSSESAAAPVTGADATWETMTDDQKVALMTKVVLPKIEALFAAYDPDSFDKFICATCHGDGVTDGNYDMDNTDLPELATADNFAEAREDQPEMVEFMENKVVPAMVAILGVDGKSFGCLNCHPAEE